MRVNFLLCTLASMKKFRRGFTLIEVLVVIGIIGLLMAILLPTLERVRHQSYIVKCAANLHALGQGLHVYANENHGAYPRTAYLAGAPYTKGTGSAGADPFTAGGPATNDLTAPLFLLLRTQKIPPVTMICPYNDVNVFTADTAQLDQHSNFTDYTKNLGYSYANPYPSAAAEKDYHLTDHLLADFAVMADLNPGPKGYNGDFTSVTATSPWSKKKKLNSDNHEEGGQNVLYIDGHVDWKTTVFAGPNGDNIFTTADGQMEASPVNRNDCVLLPSQ